MFRGKYIFLIVGFCLIATVVAAQPGGGGPPDPPDDVPISGSWILLILGAGIGALKHKLSGKKQ